MFNASEILISIIIITISKRKKKAYLVPHLPPRTLPASSHLLSPSVGVCSETESWLSPLGNGSLFLPLPKVAGRASPNPATPLAQPSLPGALLELQSKTQCLGGRQPRGWDWTGRQGKQCLRSHSGRGPAAASLRTRC